MPITLRLTLRGTATALVCGFLLSGCIVDTRTTRSERDIDGVVRAWMQARNVPAMTISIARDRVAVFSAAYGYSDIGHHAAATPSTRFRIASVTKEFTAAATLSLLQTERRSDHDRVPATATCPEGYGRISVRDLLDHSARYGRVPDYDGDTPIVNLRERLQALCGKGQHSDEFEYRNDNYLVLSDVIGSLAKMPFERVLREHVLVPNGLQHTDFGTSAADAVGYICDSRPRAVRDSAGGTSGAGGLFSTTADLERWDSAVLAGRYPGSPHYTPFEGGLTISDDTRYTNGFEVVVDPDAGPIAFHDGMSPGYSSINMIYLRRGISISIMSNCDHLEGLRALASDLYGLVS